MEQFVTYNLCELESFEMTVVQANGSNTHQHGKLCVEKVFTDDDLSDEIPPDNTV